VDQPPRPQRDQGRPCEQFGQPEDGGQWQDFHAHQVGSHSHADYWYATDLDFPSRLTRRIRIKIHLGLGEGSGIRDLAQAHGPSLYRPIEHNATILGRKGEAGPAEQMRRYNRSRTGIGGVEPATHARSQLRRRAATPHHANSRGGFGASCARCRGQPIARDPGRYVVRDKEIAPEEKFGKRRRNCSGKPKSIL
jgi:hypothetical protein